METVDIAATLPRLIREDTEIGNLWLSAFQREVGSFDEAWSQAVAGSKEAISAVSKTEKNGAPEQRYAAIVEQLRLREPDQKGNGVLTAVAAAALPWCDPSPEKALQIAANGIGTDTDTIATMAGAILGATADAEPPVEVMDADLFRAEAARLSEIARGKERQGHDYHRLRHRGLRFRHDRGPGSGRPLARYPLHTPRRAMLGNDPTHSAPSSVRIDKFYATGNYSRLDTNRGVSSHACSC